MVVGVVVCVCVVCVVRCGNVCVEGVVVVGGVCNGMLCVCVRSVSCPGRQALHHLGS